MSFLDAFQGYHQIAMNLMDQEKTAFITLRGLFCYKVMPFGLKNAGATYQRMITKMFAEQLGKTVEVYIDDMVVKSVLAEDHLGDLRAVFNTLRRHRLKLNASKCAFGVRSGKFLGFMVTQRGIEANLDQITAILNLKPPRTVREVQRLTGMAAALNRFISWSAEKSYLVAAPLLATPINGESLYIYLAASKHAVSAAIVREDYSIQRPVYYTSKTLDGVESRYLPLEKLAFALTSLDGYPNGEPNLGLMTSDTNQGPRSRDRQMMELAIQLRFPASNNVAEYVALLHGLRSAITLQANPFHVYCDSQLVVNQISREYAAKDKKMVAYLTEARKLLGEFEHVQVEHISRDLNRHADALASLASAIAPELRRIISVGVQNLPSVRREINNGECSVDQSINWMSPILAYLKDDVLPVDRKEADWIRRIAPRTTPRSSTREAPFSLTYGVEAVIPLEIDLPTIHTEYYNPVTNETNLATNLDLAEEKRDSVLIHLAAYQNRLWRMYEKRVNPWELAVGDLVLRKVIGSRRDATHGKLGPN
uniref:RNase H type-1 domain-containing protein n=1 Tax=Fagus sylvatica TaxID=28930 RepID=A0A2N9FLK1_FAGSY